MLVYDDVTVCKFVEVILFGLVFGVIGVDSVTDYLYFFFFFLKTAPPPKSPPFPPPPPPPTTPPPPTGAIPPRGGRENPPPPPPSGAGRDRRSITRFKSGGDTSKCRASPVTRRNGATAASAMG